MVSSPLYITVQTSMAGLVLCQLALSCNKRLIAVFSNPALRFLGKVSYSLYLWQQLFLVVKSPPWGVARLFPLNLLLPLGLSVLSYYAIETPALRFKQRFQR